MLAFAHQGAELETRAASVQLSWCSLGKQPCLQQHVAGNIAQQLTCKTKCLLNTEVCCSLVSQTLSSVQ